MSDLNANSSRDALAESLRGLTPSAGNLKRDQIVFSAGREKGRREVMGYVYLIGCLSCFAVGAILFIVTTETATPQPMIYVPQPVAPPSTTYPSVEEPPAPTASEDRTLQDAMTLRRKILSDGIEFLPELQPIPQQAAKVEPLEELLPDEDLPRVPGAGSYYLFPPR